MNITLGENMAPRLQVIKGGNGVLGMGLADYLWVSAEGLVNFKKKTILVGKDAKGDPVPIMLRWSYASCACPEEYCANEGVNDDFCPNAVTRVLSPCFYLPDPTRPQPCYLVLCEVRDLEDKCVVENYRSLLRKAMKARGPASKLVWFGFEQTYQLFDACGETGPNLAERKFLSAERHLGACFDAGLLIHSIWNPTLYHEWEFKVGVRGFPQDLDPDPPSALTVCDHLVVAQYLLEKVGGEKGVAPKWTNLTAFVSTAALREPGSDQKVTSDLLIDALDNGENHLRAIPHPIHGGIQCIEVNGSTYENPYRMALDILEAVWPLDVTNAQPPNDEDDEESE